ncbi:MAG: hypothetical protein GX992_00535 [Clostridium sp.]|nr:hypothetical protein [Clostridium sp.]
MSKIHIKSCKTLKTILFDRSITYKTLANKMGISENNLLFKINGKRRWWIDECLTVTKLLGYKDAKEVFPEIFNQISS